LRIGLQVEGVEEIGAFVDFFYYGSECEPFVAVCYLEALAEDFFFGDFF